MTLDELFRGPPTAAKWAALGRYLNSQKIISGVGVRISRDAIHGTVISARRSGDDTGSSSSSPFKVLNASSDEKGLRVYVRPGMISSPYWNGHNVPSNMHLDDSEAANKCYLPTPATGYVLLKSTISTGETPAVTGMVLEYLSTIPADTATVARLAIAKVTLESGKIASIYQNVTSNLLHALYFESYSYPDRWGQMFGPISPSMS